MHRLIRPLSNFSDYLNMFGLGHLQGGNVAGAKMAFEEAMDLDRNFAPATLIMEMHAVNSAN